MIPSDPGKHAGKQQQQEDESTPLHTDSILVQDFSSNQNGVPNGAPNGVTNGAPKGAANGVANGVALSVMERLSVPERNGGGSVLSRGSVHRHRGDPAGANHSPHGKPNTQIMPVLKNPDVLLALTGTVYAAAVQV